MSLTSELPRPFMAWSPETADIGKRAGAWRRRYFLGKFGEDAALFLLRRRLGARMDGRAHALLAAIHRRVLRALDRLPHVPAAAPVRRLGVARSETFVAPHDPVWATLYEIEASLIRKALGERWVELHHIGSTAVPGLTAKPIIDLALGLPPETFAQELGEAVRLLAKIGYRYLGDRRGLGGHYMEKGAFPMRTHALQLHPAGGRELARLLRFRDQLRADSALAGRYDAIKRALAPVSGGDRRVYVWSKAHWVNDLLLERAGPQAWGDWLLAQDPPSLYRMHVRHRARSSSVRAP